MRTDTTAEQFLKALDGRVYRPAVPDAVIGPSRGQTSSGDHVQSLSLQYLLGKSKESVIVESSIESRRHDAHLALHNLVFELARMRRPGFPMTLDRSTIRIPVEGRQKSFTVYSAGPAAVAITSIGDVSVMVRCGAKRLPRLSLERLAAEDLRQALAR